MSYWDNERMIAEAEALAAGFHRIPSLDQDRALRGEVLTLLRRCTSEEGKEYVAKIDYLQARIAAQDKRIAELEAQLAATLALNQRNVDDATRIINANKSGLELAYYSVVEWGKREQRITDLERQLAESNAEYASLSQQCANLLDKLAAARVSGQLWHDRAMTGWKEGDDDVQA